MTEKFKESQEQQQEFVEEKKRRVRQVHKFLDVNVEKKHRFRWVTTAADVVYLKHIDVVDGAYHERVSMEDDLKCVQRIMEYVEKEMEQEQEKERKFYKGEK